MSLWKIDQSVNYDSVCSILWWTQPFSGSYLVPLWLNLKTLNIIISFGLSYWKLNLGTQEMYKQAKEKLSGTHHTRQVFSACRPAHPPVPVGALAFYLCVNIGYGPAHPCGPVWMHLKSEISSRNIGCICCMTLPWRKIDAIGACMLYWHITYMYSKCANIACRGWNRCILLWKMPWWQQKHFPHY